MSFRNIFIAMVMVISSFSVTFDVTAASVISEREETNIWDGIQNGEDLYWKILEHLEESKNKFANSDSPYFVISAQDIPSGNIWMELEAAIKSEKALQVEYRPDAGGIFIFTLVK